MFASRPCGDADLGLKRKRAAAETLPSGRSGQRRMDRAMMLSPILWLEMTCPRSLPLAARTTSPTSPSTAAMTSNSRQAVPPSNAARGSCVCVCVCVCVCARVCVREVTPILIIIERGLVILNINSTCARGLSNAQDRTLNYYENGSMQRCERMCVREGVGGRRGRRWI